MSGRGEVVATFPNDMPAGVIPFRGPERREVRSSAMLGRARRQKGEYLLPFASSDNERPDARLFVETMSQLPCKVTGFYVGGEIFQVEPETILPGQWARLEIPEEICKKIVSSNLAEVACGILGQVETERTGMGRLAYKLPMGAHVAREQVGGTLTIKPGTTVTVQWQPEVASRFKRFAAEVMGDKDALLINDFRFGNDSLLLTSTPVPLAVAMMPGAFEIPDMIIPGIIVTASFSNRSGEEITLGGGMVFENVEEELLALQKKYEEEQGARGKEFEKIQGDLVGMK